MKKVYIILLIVLVVIGTEIILSHKKMTASTVATGAPTSTPPQQPTTTFKESGDDVNGMHIGYIKSISTIGSTPNVAAQNTYEMSVDYVQWLSCKNCPDDYQVKNDNTKLRTLTISPDVTILLQTYMQNASGGIQWNQKISLTDFTKLFFNPTETYNPKHLLYWFTIKNGVVTAITEQYQP